MAGRDHEEDEWIDEVKQREEFVLEENHHDFDVYGGEVTYRRAPDLGSTAFVGAQFDALDEELYHPMLMKSETKPPAFAESPFAAPSAVIDSKGSPDLEPTGPVPESSAVNYHEVNPTFESDVPADDVFRQLKASIRPHVEEYECFSDWTINAFAMVAAEEVTFSIQLHRITSKNVVRVDFYLREGNEVHFLEIVDKIRKDCRDLDRDLAGLLKSEFSFDIFESWSTSGELFPGSMTVDVEDLVLLLEDITSVHSHAFTRYEAAKQLKDYCQYSANRDSLFRSLCDRFVQALEKMMRDDNEDIVRFAIYTILNFAQDEGTWSGMNFPTLPQLLQTIGQTVRKPSTKKLANDLHSTIIAQSGAIAVGGQQ